jgi:hypothetical protein
MHQQTLPLWIRGKAVTYTEVQTFCVQQYAAQGPRLIQEVSQHLEKLATCKGLEAILGVLRALNDLSIELSAFNQEWNGFSLAVFESIVFPRSITWAVKYLQTSFTTTLRRFDDVPAKS